MWARKRIDIGWTDLLCGLWYSLRGGSPFVSQQELEKSWSPAGNGLACLSVRTGFDLLLNQLQYPPGSEILISAVTIQDMVRVIAEHGLVPIPIDLDPATMAPLPETVEQAITPRTKAILIAHLFGGIIDFTPYAEIAQKHQLLLIEDCAQAFDGNRYPGHPQSAVVMFSFGPIKTATALGGALLTVRDTALLQGMKTEQQTYPVQQRSAFLKRVLTYSTLKFIGGYYPFGCLVGLCRLLGLDYETLLNGAVRNFPAEQLFLSLRQQPSTPLCRLLQRRLKNFQTERQDRRTANGRLLHQELSPQFRCPSGDLPRHTYWVFALELQRGEEIVPLLRQQGFDAAMASQLRPILPPPDRQDLFPQHASDCLSRVVYLPLYPEFPQRELERMAKLVKQPLQEFNRDTSHYQAD